MELFLIRYVQFCISNAKITSMSYPCLHRDGVAVLCGDVCIKHCMVCCVEADLQTERQTEPRFSGNKARPVKFFVSVGSTGTVIFEYSISSFLTIVLNVVHVHVHCSHRD